jgi:hypothetical protein
MTSLAEAENKFGRVVRGAGGAIFGVEKVAWVGGRQEEKLQIGTRDGFVKIAVLLNQPNIAGVLRERTALLVKHAGELRAPVCPALGVSLGEGAPADSD